MADARAASQASLEQLEQVKTRVAQLSEVKWGFKQTQISLLLCGFAKFLTTISQI